MKAGKLLDESMNMRQGLKRLVQPASAATIETSQSQRRNNFTSYIIKRGDSPTNGHESPVSSENFVFFLSGSAKY